MKWILGLIFCALGSLMALVFAEDNSSFSSDEKSVAISGFVFGLLFFGGGLIVLMLACRDFFWARKKQEQSTSSESDEAEDSESDEDSFDDGISSEDLDEPDEDDVSSDLSDVTGEVPVVEEEEVVPEPIKTSLETAQEYAAQSWRVVRVVFSDVPRDGWQALVVIRSVETQMPTFFQIRQQHEYCEDFFALEEGQEVRFTCEGENYDPMFGVSPYIEDYLRVASSEPPPLIQMSESSDA